MEEEPKQTQSGVTFHFPPTARRYAVKRVASSTLIEKGMFNEHAFLMLQSSMYRPLA